MIYGVPHLRPWGAHKCQRVTDDYDISKPALHKAQLLSRWEVELQNDRGQLTVCLLHELITASSSHPIPQHPQSHCFFLDAHLLFHLCLCYPLA